MKAAWFFAVLPFWSWSAITIYDFGTETSPVQTGAVCVTVSGGSGVTWDHPAALRRAVTNALVRAGREDRASTRSAPPESYHTALSCDAVTSTHADTLRFAVSRGAYKVVIYTGRTGGSAAQVWDLTVKHRTQSVRATYAGGHELRKLVLDAEADAQGLTLEIATRSRWALNALVLIPASEWSQAETCLAEIERPLFLLPDEELKKWKEVPREDRNPAPQWSEAEKARGFACYTRPWADPIWPRHVPLQHEIDAPVRAFAAPGEYEPLTFALHALKPLERVEITLSAFTNATTVIPREACDLRVVRAMYVRPNYNAVNTYYLAPDVLMPWQPQGLPRGENLRLWLTVKVPLGQPEGLYTSEATVCAEGVTLRVPLTLRVVPITLLKDESIVFGQYYYTPLRNMRSAPDAFLRAWWQAKTCAELEDLREHGQNTVTVSVWSAWDKEKKCWRHAVDETQRMVDLMRAVGFTKPLVCSIATASVYAKYMEGRSMGSHLSQLEMPPQPFFEEMTRLVREIEAEARRRQWPELLYYPVDEPSTSPLSVAFMTRVLAAIKQVPGVRTYVTADPEHEQFAAMKPYVDVWCCQPFSLGRKAVLDDMRTRGVEYWCYPNHISGENDHTPTLGARMTYGYGLWESGYRALIPWIYQHNSGDPWNYLDGRTQDFFNRSDDEGTPIPVTLWEAYREGIDDGRYLYTLQTWIARAREQGLAAEADAAQKVVDALMAAIPVQPKYKEAGLWAATTLDVWRWRIAEQILILQKKFN